MASSDGAPEASETPGASLVRSGDGGTLMHYLTKIAQRTFAVAPPGREASSTRTTGAVNGSRSNLLNHAAAETAADQTRRVSHPCESSTRPYWMSSRRARIAS